ncbi:MAG: sigma-70 region 4 domain-containing protein [Actinomycetia bacterium]|nr:sigma-70 region 4 domain-containing protein [Actinomycetes bacterium]
MRTSEEALLNAFPYESFAAVKRAVRILPQLISRAQDGDQAASALVMDIERAMGIRVDPRTFTYRATHNDVLTETQQQAVWLHLVLGYKLREVAGRTGISPQAVNRRVTIAIERMMKFLTTGQTRVWTRAEDDFLRDYLLDYGAVWVSQELQVPVDEVYRRFRYLQRKNRIA